MAQGTSERACDRCRERRVKCDKQQPTCLRCEKLGKPCPGYDKKRKFVDEGATLRKKYQHSDDPVSSSDDLTLNASGSVPTKPQSDAPTSNIIDGIGDDATATANANATATAQASATVQSASSLLPNVLDSSNLAPPVDALITDSPLVPLTGVDPLLDELWTDEVFDPQFFDLVPEEYYSASGIDCGFIRNIPEIIDEVDLNDTSLHYSTSTTPFSSTGIASFGLFSGEDSNVWAPESQLKTSAQISHERDHEMAYLIRHFTESVAPWMDLFDRDKHFTHLVPLKALRDALLRNAVAAVAAKQLGRTRGQRPFWSSQCQRPSAMEVLEETTEVDWFYKAANYYDKAIAFSRQYLQAVSGDLDPSAPPSRQAALSMASSDDLVVAVSIFSLYESLDEPDTGWLQHLIGLKSLLTSASPAQQVQNQIMPTLTVGRLASFWNFARADYQAAYLNHQKTLLDTEDVAMWNQCGLEIRSDGSLYTSTDYVKNDPIHSLTLTQLVAHTLLWLVLRTMNYLTSEEQDDWARQKQWDQLARQLDHWYGNLPATYQPVVQIRHPLTSKMGGHEQTTPSPRLTESFFSIDVCAAALQLYHFARILLLLHRPVHASSSSFSSHSSAAAAAFGNRLKQYREVSNEAIKHAHEIIGIALGRPQPAIRVEMLLPLYVAGACLEENEERKVVLELLKAVEKDTGYSTEGKCKELVLEWGWTAEPAGIA